MIPTQGGVSKEYPYFSQHITMGGQKGVNSLPKNHLNKPQHQQAKNIFSTFDPVAERLLNEYTWFDHG